MLHRCSVLIFNYTLLLPEGQTGEAWKPSKKKWFSDIWKDWIAIYFYIDACRIVIVGGVKLETFLCRKLSVGLAKILVVCVSGALYPGEAIMLWS